MLRIFIKFIFLTQTILVFFSEPTSSQGNFGLLRLKYGQPCKANYECSTGFRCVDSSCRCPKDSIWSNEHQRCKVCPYRWLPFNDKCYFISDTKKDWHGAKLECEHRKSSLLVIEPEHVLDFSINFFNTCRLTSSFYVGAKADVLPGNWTWLNGKSIPSSGHIWADCYSPTKSGDDALRLVNGCALLGKFGLSASNCRTRESFICYQDENSKFKMTPFTQVKHSFQIMNEIEKKCNHDYQCLHGQKCVQNICSCEPGSVYAFGSKKCIDAQIIAFVDYLATKQSDDLFVSNNSLTWYDAYMWSLSNKWNLYAPKNLLDLIHLSDFLAQNNLEGPFWIGGIRVDDVNFWIDKKRIEDGPWFRSFKNCNFNLANSVENLCLAIEKNELVFRDCLSDFKFIAFEGSLNNSIDLADFNISLPLVRITRTLTLRNVIVVTPRSRSGRLRRNSELVPPPLIQVQNLVVLHMQRIFVSYVCTGFWILNAEGSFSLTLVAFKVFPGIEYENEIEIYNAYFDRFDLFFTANNALYISILRPEFTILKIEIFDIELTDVKEEIFLTLVIVTTTKCVGFSGGILECTTTVLIKPNDVPLLTTPSPSTSASSTTVASTTEASTTMASTTVPSTTEASTTMASTTVPSTTVPSTTVASTTVASTTVPSTTVVSTTVASTTVDSTTDRINRTLTLRNVIVVTPLTRNRMRRNSELVPPPLIQFQNLVVFQMQSIFVSYTCTGFWIPNADGSFSLTLVAFKVFTGIEYENEIEIYNAYFDRFDLFFTDNNALYISLLSSEFRILKIEIFDIELTDVPLLTTPSPSTSASLTTVPSTTLATTPVASTTLTSSNIGLTTIIETTAFNSVDSTASVTP